MMFTRGIATVHVYMWSAWMHGFAGDSYSYIAC